MGFRFFKRAKILPGVSLNIGKSGVSVSLGPRGLKTTLGAKGIKQSIGLPGTGLSYQTKYRKWGSLVPGGKSAAQSGEKGARGGKAATAGAAKAAGSDADKLNLGFFARLTCPKEEKALVGGLQAYLQGDNEKAESLFRQALRYGDAAFTLGIMYLNDGRYEEAAEMLGQALKAGDGIGVFYRKYGLETRLFIQVSPFYCNEFEPDEVTAGLALVEALQQTGGYEEACGILRSLHEKWPGNLDVMISMADLFLEEEPGNRELMSAISEMTRNLENESQAHAVMLMYKAEAFDNMGLVEPAIATLTTALRKKKDRSPELLLEMQFQRGVLYMRSGKNAQALKDMQAVYAIDPAYANVGELLSRLQGAC